MIRDYMKIFILMACLFTVNVMAQEQEYQLKGRLGINSTTKKGIDFTLRWKEKDGKANGTYSDNFYTNSARMKGISGSLGRIFVVTFPKEIKGVQTISFLGTDLKTVTKATTVPDSIVLRNGNGKPVNTTTIQANLSEPQETRVAQRQEEEKCQEGFGALAGFCGVYSGLLSEELDPKQKCNLLAFNNTRLVLDENSEVGLMLGELSGIVQPPVHRVGRIFADPTSTRIDLMSRICRPLNGTSFGGDDCKRLNLAGSFTIVKGVKHFSGRYTILDEKTNESCRYTLSMDQAI
jgi:hypothetical protein